jgi:hypothetical protein
MPLHRFRAAPLAPAHDQILVYQTGDDFDRRARTVLALVERVGVVVRTCIETPLSQEATSETREVVFDRWQVLIYAISEGDWATKQKKPITARFCTRPE